MSLTKHQHRVLIGTLLGDGHLEKNGRYVRLKIDHSHKQKAYVWWKYQVFKNLVSQPPKLQRIFDSRTNNVYQHWRFSTKSLSIFTEYHALFYGSGSKSVPDDICTLVHHPLSLATWYMDDGARRTDCKALRLHTNCYSYESQQSLQRVLATNFGIHTTLHKAGNSWVLYIPSKEAKQFSTLIRPFMLSEFSDKLL